MAQRRDRDAVQARGVEHRGAAGHGDRQPVDREVNDRSCLDFSHGADAFRAAMLQNMRFHFCAGNACITDVIGECANWPSPQMEASFIASDSSSSRSKSAAVPLPCVQPVRISTIFCEPMRHGTHFPQDSLRKKRTAFSAMSSMQRPSAHTTMAPEPIMEPAAASDLKSMRTSTIDAGRYPDDGPDGANAFNCLPSVDAARQC